MQWHFVWTNFLARMSSELFLRGEKSLFLEQINKFVMIFRCIDEVSVVYRLIFQPFLHLNGQ